MTEANPSAGELIAWARDRQSRNGNVLGIVLAREWSRDVLLLAEELALSLAALRIAAPYVIGADDAEAVNDAIRRLSTTLAS